MITAQDFVEALEQAVEIPSLPRAIVRLLEVTSDPDHSRSDVTAIVRSDPGLASEALRMANSPVVRNRSTVVESVDEALTILGETWLMRAVTARGLRTMSVEPLDGYGMDVDALWDHSIRVALLAESLAERSGVVPAVAYTAGLLVDVGKLVASGALADLGSRVSDVMSAQDNLTFDAIERMLLGVDHAELGGRVARAWGLPESLCTAIAYHHRPDQAGEHKTLVQTVHAADSLAYLTGRGLGVDGMLYRMTNEPLPELVFDRKDVDTLLLRIESKVQHVEALM